MGEASLPETDKPARRTIMKFKTEHFEQARRVARQWRREGYSHVVVVRQGARASRCYPCRQQDVPPLAVASWDYYPIPTQERLAKSAPMEQTASRAELWVAATIAYGNRYAAAVVN
jgi:hypothetical protein